MYITKAYCIELGRSISITEARNAFFAQPKPRQRFTFHCSSLECRKQGDTPVTITAINYDKVALDHPRFKSPHFRSQNIDAHDPNCLWILEEEARLVESQEQAGSGGKGKESPLGRGVIETSTFLDAIARRDHTSAEKPSGSEQEEQVVEARPVIKKPEGRRPVVRRRISSGSFGDLVHDYLAVRRKKAWDTPLEIKGIPTKTYGKFFKRLDWYNHTYWHNHAHYGSVRVSRIYPKNFDLNSGIPSAVVLLFDQEVTLDDVTAKPSIYITKDQFESMPSAHVLVETIANAQMDDAYQDRMWCHFYGYLEPKEVAYTDKSGEEKQFTTLNVVLHDMSTLELILRPKEQRTHNGDDEH